MGTRRHKPLLSRLADKCQRVLLRIGVRVYPYLMVRENERAVEPIPLPTGFAFRQYFLEDSALLARSRNKSEDDPSYLNRFRRGQLCFGLEHNGLVAAVLWCDAKEISGLLYEEALPKGAVYFFDAHSNPTYRGQSLAPALRQRTYQALEDLGYSRFLSISEYFNTPARRFKEKLGARNEWLGLYLGMGNLGRSFVLRRFAMDR